MHFARWTWTPGVRESTPLGVNADKDAVINDDSDGPAVGPHEGSALVADTIASRRH